MCRSDWRRGGAVRLVHIHGTGAPATADILETPGLYPRGRSASNRARRVDGAKRGREGRKRKARRAARLNSACSCGILIPKLASKWTSGHGSENLLPLKARHYPRRYNHEKDWIVAKLKLDLHDIYNRGKSIDAALESIIEEAVQKRIVLVEIIPGKGSGQLKKKVLRFLQQKHIKSQYHRVEKDGKNWGRLFVHFRF
jgi:hypothetical protein